MRENKAPSARYGLLSGVSMQSTKTLSVLPGRGAVSTEIARPGRCQLRYDPHGLLLEKVAAVLDDILATLWRKSRILQTGTINPPFWPEGIIAILRSWGAYPGGCLYPVSPFDVG